MTGVRLDELGWQKFEQLCQSLLKSCLSLAVECWGGRGDLGRDAYCPTPLPLRGPGSAVPGPFVFQVKFIRGANAAGARSHQAVRSAVAKESRRLEERVAGGIPAPAYYVFLTNAPLSADTRRHIIARIQQVLADTQVVCWGADDIVSMLHGAHQVREAFPELAEPYDLLRRASGATDSSASVVEAEADNLPAEIAELLKRAKDHSDSGRYAVAITDFERAVEFGTQLQSAEAVLKAQIGLAEARIRDERDVSGARDLLLGCVARLRLSDKGVTTRRHTVLGLLGDAELLLGHVGEARAVFRDAVENARALNDRFSEAHHLIGLCRAEEYAGNLEEARRLVEEGIRLLRAQYREETGEAKQLAATNLAATLATSAVLFRRTGKLADALGCLTQAAKLFEEAKSEDNLGRTLALKGEIHFAQAQWEDARECLQNALERFESIANAAGQCRCLQSMARLLFAFGRKEDALRLLEAAFQVAKYARPERDSLPYLTELAVLCRTQGEARKALRFLRCAKAVAEAQGTEIDVARCLVLEAEYTSAKASDPSRSSLLRSAMRFVEKAIQTCEIRGGRAELMRKLGELHARIGETHEAERWIRRALQEHEAIDDRLGAAECLADLAAAARERGVDDEAVAYLVRLLNIEGIHAVPSLYAAGYHNLGTLKLSRGDIDGAKQCLAEAETVAVKHRLDNVLDALLLSKQRLEDAERFYEPAARNLPSLIEELHFWCTQYPGARDAIVPLWYYFHRLELWRICRTMLGAKFLVCTLDGRSFERIAAALRGHGRLCVWGTPFPVRKIGRTELIPVPTGSSFLMPSHVTFVGFRGRGEPEQISKALQKKLRDHPYLLIPFGQEAESKVGSQLCAYGRHIRLPERVTRFMLGPLVRASSEYICLPLAESKTMPDVRGLLARGWENRMVPVLPTWQSARGVTVICEAAVKLQPFLKQDHTAGAPARNPWDQLLSSVAEGPYDALQRFSAVMDDIAAASQEKKGSVAVSLLSGL